MESSKIDSFPLYDACLERVKEKKNRSIDIIKNKTALFINISDQDKSTAEIIYLLILHHYLKKEKISAEQLVGKRITFLNQKSLINDRGIVFQNFKDMAILEIIHEFLEMDN